MIFDNSTVLSPRCGFIDQPPFYLWLFVMLMTLLRSAPGCCLNLFWRCFSEPYWSRSGLNCMASIVELRNADEPFIISALYKNYIFQCMGKIFCGEFQRYPLKFHTKYLTHTLKDVYLFAGKNLRGLRFKSWLKCPSDHSGLRKP